MPQTIQVRQNDFGPFQYQIVEYDETTDGLIPVDITGETITFTLFRQVQQSNGEFTSVEITKEQLCSIIDPTEGWIQYNVKENEMATHGMYTVTLKRTGEIVGRTYPRYEEQWIRVLPLTTPPAEFTPEP